MDFEADEPDVILEVAVGRGAFGRTEALAEFEAVGTLGIFGLELFFLMGSSAGEPGVGVELEGAVGRAASAGTEDLVEFEGIVALATFELVFSGVSADLEDDWMEDDARP